MTTNVFYLLFDFFLSVITSTAAKSSKALE